MKLLVWFILPIAFCLVTGCPGSSAPTKPTQEAPAASKTPVQAEAAMGLEGDREAGGNCKLFVKGVDITSGNHVRLHAEYQYAELPLTAIVKALGAKVEWKNEAIATITFADQDYILNITEQSLVEAGTTFNLLVLAPGSKHPVYRQVIGDEFIVDSDSLLLLLHDRGVKRIIIDDEMSVITIE